MLLVQGCMPRHHLWGLLSEVHRRIDPVGVVAALSCSALGVTRRLKHRYVHTIRLVVPVPPHMTAMFGQWPSRYAYCGSSAGCNYICRVLVWQSCAARGEKYRRTAPDLARQNDEPPVAGSDAPACAVRFIGSRAALEPLRHIRGSPSDYQRALVFRPRGSSSVLH